ncbi:MAG: chromosomal replication initiator protein DnaA, partial [Alistipes sp.]|nr:chromosomal replication initiator protein DnaA [Alistipes sp.]
MTQTETYKALWSDCLDRLRLTITEEEFVKWFKPVWPIDYDGQKLRLRVPNESFVASIEKRYLRYLRPIISELYGADTQLHYAVPRKQQPAAVEEPQSVATPTDTANIKNPFVIPGLRRIMFDPQLSPNLTLDTFIEGECNRLARSAGLTVAVSPGNNAFNPLYIYGDSGLGKTHIVQAIGHEVRQRHPELQVLYVSMNKFQAQFQTAY